ncbi:MAG: hypothetical protein ACI8WT_002750 [Clostridium sp.]|jgi:hypothetical protein
MDCSVIKDLMPLYIEELTSEPSNNLIEEHINNCEDCRQILVKLKADIIPSKEVEFDKVENLPNTIIKRIRRNINEKILMAASITLILGIMTGIFRGEIFMFMALLGPISIIIFTIAIFVSIPISRKNSSFRTQFKVLGNCAFVLSIAFCGLLLLLFREYFSEGDNFFILLILEILYNIILSITLRVYARLKLPKDDIVDVKNVTNKKLFIITFVTLAFISTVITVPIIILEGNKIVDNITLSFVNDSEVVGKWTTVDYVSIPEDFNPTTQPSTGRVFLNEMTFLENGQMKKNFVNTKGQQGADIPSPWSSWTKGYVINKSGDHTLSKYDIREINGDRYMFFEWKNASYIYFHKDPSYYVLRKDLNK